jgi:hypothetical protein
MQTTRYGPSPNLPLRERLLARQSTDELRRKAAKAQRRAHWTQETLELCHREAVQLMRDLGWYT